MKRTGHDRNSMTFNLSLINDVVARNISVWAWDQFDNQKFTKIRKLFRGNAKVDVKITGSLATRQLFNILVLSESDEGEKVQQLYLWDVKQTVELNKTPVVRSYDTIPLVLITEI